MASRNFNPLEVFFQMETDFLRETLPSARLLRFQPGADIYETEAALVIKIELPGVRPDDLHITLSADDRTLTISGERGEMHNEATERIRFYQLEIFYGTFEREISLPSSVRFDREAISANYKDGFLVITLPKREDQSGQTRTIEITRG